MINNFLQKFHPKSKHPNHLWKIDKFDIIIWSVAILLYCFIFISYCTIEKKPYKEGLTSFLSTQDSFCDLYGALNLFSRTKGQDIFFQHTRYNQELFIGPFFVRYFVLRFCIFISFGNIYVGQLIYVFLTMMSSTFLFRRFLSYLRLVKYPALSTLIYLFIPYRLTTYRYIPVSDSLFHSFIWLSFILYHHGSFFALFTIISAVFTRVEGFILFPIFLTLYIIRGSFFYTLILIFCFVLFLITLNMNHTDIFFFHSTKYSQHKVLKTSYFRFILPYDPKKEANDILQYPLSEFLNNVKSIVNLRFIEGHMILYLILIYGGFLTFAVSPDVGVFEIFWNIFITFLKDDAFFRASIIPELLAIICGFDITISDRSNTKVLWALGIVLTAFLCIYNSREIDKNKNGIRIWQYLVNKS